MGYDNYRNSVTILSWLLHAFVFVYADGAAGTDLG